MNTPDQDFEMKLIELNSILKDVQDKIAKVEKERIAYVEEHGRKNFLLMNSIDMSEVSIERHNDTYFIIGKDDTFSYVLRLTQYQAEVLADDLDAELGKVQIERIQAKELETNIVQNMFAPYLRNHIQQ